MLFYDDFSEPVVFEVLSQVKVKNMRVSLAKSLIRIVFVFWVSLKQVCFDWCKGNDFFDTKVRIIYFSLSACRCARNYYFCRIIIPCCSDGQTMDDENCSKYAFVAERQA